MAEIPWKKVVESCGASFDCVRDIFVHSLQAEQFWISRLSGKNADGIFDTPFSKFTKIDTIQEYADKVEAETNEYLKTLTDKKLQSVFEFKGWDGGYSFEDDFMEWLGSPTLEDYQEEIRKKVKDILNRLEKNGFYLGSEYKEIESNVKILLGKNESEKLDYEDEEVVKVLYWISKDDRVKWHLFEKPKVLKGVIRKKRKVVLNETNSKKSK